MLETLQANYSFTKLVIENDGSLMHDYSNDTHYNYVLDSLGGKQFLKSKFPTIYEAIENTRNRSLQTINTQQHNEISGIQSDDMKEEQEVDFVNFGKRLTNAENDSASDDSPYFVECGVSANFIEKKVFICTNGVIKDENDDVILSFYPYKKDCSTMMFNDIRALSNATYSTAKNFKVKNDFYWGAVEDGKSVVYSKSIYFEKKYDDDTQAVKIINVTDPMNTKSKRNETTIIYNRSADDLESFDYIYPKAVNPQSIVCDIMMPFSGSLELNDDFEILGIDKNDESYKIKLYFNNEGIAVFDNFDNIKIKLETLPGKKNNTKLTWVFPEDWKCQLALSRFKGNHYPVVDFSATFPLTIKNLILPGQSPTTDYITIDSRITESSTDPTLKQIPRILIYWGCMGKNTKILMADGKEREVSSLKIGDKVLSSENKVITIKNIITGTEKTIMHIQTVNDKIIYLTDSHPVNTNEKLKRIMDLTPMDSIQIKDSNTDKAVFEKVKFMYPVDYNDTVYSLEFEGENIIWGNGLAIGDFNTQNKKISNDKGLAIEKSEEASKLQDEFEELFNILAKGDEHNE